MKKPTKTKGFIMLTVAAVMLVMLTLCFLACRYTMKAETHVRYVGHRRRLPKPSVVWR